MFGRQRIGYIRIGILEEVRLKFKVESLWGNKRSQRQVTISQCR